MNIDDGVIASGQELGSETTEIPEKSLHEEISEQLAQVQERERDEAGRFTAAEKAAQKAEATQAVGKTVSRETGVAPGAPAEMAMPQSWKPELKAEWDKLPDTVRKYTLEREAEVHKGFTKMDEERNFGKAIKDVVTPYMAVIQSEGGTAAQAIQSLLNTAYTLRTAQPQQKVQLFRQLAMQYQVPLAELFKEVNNQGAVNPDVQRLEQQLQQLQQAQTQREQMAKEQEAAQAMGQVTQFAASEGHEHFHAVRERMSYLISNGLAQDLEDAYQQSIWSDPTLRSTMLARETQADAAKRVADVAARAAAARNAGSSVTGSAGSGSQKTNLPERSLREELAANLAAVTNR